MPSGIRNNSLIEIYGEGDIPYEVVLDYMASKINVAYLENVSSAEHLKYIRINIIITVDLVDSNVKVECMVF